MTQAALQMAEPVKVPALPVVRLAVPADEAHILAMCERLHAENGLFSLKMDKVRDLIRRYYERKGTTIGVIGPVGSPEGVICLVFSDFYYTDDWHISEVWNFVDEPYRQSRNAEALIEFGKRCSDQIGVPLIIGVITRARTAAKIRLYRKALGAPAGAFFVYNGKWNDADPLDGKVWKDLLTEQSRLREIPPGSRVVAPDVLMRLGDGDIERGRAMLDSFLKRKSNGAR